MQRRRRFAATPCLAYAKIFPRDSVGRRFCGLKLDGTRESGEASVVVVLSVVVLSEVAGVVVAIGVDSAGVVAVVLSVVDAGGFTTVVLFSVSAGEAAGAAVSVFCSHATRSAALARMQIYFFIGCG